MTVRRLWLGGVQPAPLASPHRGLDSLMAPASLASLRSAPCPLGLPNWDKPALACLASRLPTGTGVTVERLTQVDRCEAGVRALGFAQVRARYHGATVRLEVPPGDLPRFADPAVQVGALAAARTAGFSAVLLDLSGYRR